MRASLHRYLQLFNGEIKAMLLLSFKSKCLQYTQKHKVSVHGTTRLEYMLNMNTTLICIYNQQYIMFYLINFIDFC